MRADVMRLQPAIVSLEALCPRLIIDVDLHSLSTHFSGFPFRTERWALIEQILRFDTFS